MSRQIKTKLEAELALTLERIAKGYQTPDQLRRSSQREWGLDYEEALEYAYDNIQQLAKNAIKGLRKPKGPLT